MNFEPIDDSLISLRGAGVLDVFEFGVLFDDGVFLVSPLDEVEGIGAEHAIELQIDGGVYLLVEVLFEDLAEEVNHGFEEVLISEYVFGLAVAEEDADVHIADFFAFSF